VLVGIGMLLLAALLYWLFVVTEGAYLGARYLGARVVAWTYDLTARRYDQIKQFNPLDDAWLLAMPMLRALNGVESPLILDVATGTGRFALALLKRPHFTGTLIGLDLSHKMLERAAQTLTSYRGRVTLIRRDAQDLPFPDATFDAVSCLEALEFMPSPTRVIDEMVRVLRPGGVLLLTNRRNWERRLMPGKAFADDDLRAYLQEAGLSQVEFRPWQVYYDLVWARKAGPPSRLGRGTASIEEVLRCPACAHAPLQRGDDALACPACGVRIEVQDGIVRMA